MYNIILDNEKYRYDISELLKLFIAPSEFRFIALGEKPASGMTICYPDCMKDKNDLKRYYFGIMQIETGYTPPWGILTGVRPVKLVNELFRSGLTEKQVRDMLGKEYLLREDKIEILVRTSLNQRKSLMTTGNGMVSIYIGIPFCPSRCVYCSFTSNIATEKAIERYFAALTKELEFVAHSMKKQDIKAETIYLGGGTPTSISCNRLNELLDMINDRFDMRHVRELTVEAGRPDTITEEKLQIIANHGCSRISINPQSMHQKTLDAIGRNHTPAQILNAFEMALKFPGIGINADVIAGLPGEEASDFAVTLKKMIELKPTNITVHTMALKRASRLREINENYNYSHCSETEEMTSSAYAELAKAGYEPYYLYRQKQMSGNFENVGYTLKNKECIYNIRIMEEKQTNIAIGAGGISKIYYPEEDRIERIPNVSNYEVYIDRIDEMIRRKKNSIFDKE